MNPSYLTLSKTTDEPFNYSNPKNLMIWRIILLYKQFQLVLYLPTVIK